MLNKTNFNVLFYIVLLFLITWLIPVFKQIPRVPGEGFYVLILPIAFLLFYPSIYKSGFFVLLSTLLFLDFFYEVTGMYNDTRNLAGFRPISRLFQMAFIPISIYVFVQERCNNTEINRLFKLMIASFGLTLVSTIIALFFFPTIARDLSSASTEVSLRDQYSLFNIASYALLFNYAIIGPIFLLLPRIKMKIFSYFMFGLIGFGLLYAEIFTAFFIFVINVLIFYFVKLFRIKTIKSYFVLFLGIVSIGYLLLQFVIALLVFLGSYFSNLEQFSTKIQEVVYFISEGEALEGTNLEGYELRRIETINQFNESPYIGGNISSGHHFWLDNLAKFGIIGTFPFFIIFFYFYFHFQNKIKNQQLKVMFFHLLLMFIAIGINKNITLIMPLTIFFIAPFLIKYIDDRLPYDQEL